MQQEKPHGASGCLNVLVKWTFYSVMAILAIVFLAPLLPEPPTQQKQPEPITYTIDKEDIIEFKAAYYYTITLNVSEGRKPTLKEIEEIFHDLLKPNMEKLALFIWLPKMPQHDGAYANCLKTKYGDKSCTIFKE